MTEIAKRVPIEMNGKAVGTAYVQDDEIFMVVKNLRIPQEVEVPLNADYIQGFFLGVCYLPEKAVVSDVSPGAKTQ